MVITIVIWYTQECVQEKGKNYRISTRDNYMSLGGVRKIDDFLRFYTEMDKCLVDEGVPVTHTFLVDRPTVKNTSSDRGDLDEGRNVGRRG